MEYSGRLVIWRKFFEQFWINKYITELMVEINNSNMNNTVDIKENTMMFDLNVYDEVL